MPLLRSLLLVPACLAPLVGPAFAQEEGGGAAAAQADERPAADAQAGGDDPVTATLEAVAERLTGARAELEALAGDAAEGTPEAALRAALARRVALLEEVAELLAALDDATAAEAALAAREAAAREALAALEAADAAAPDVPTREGFAALEATVAERRRALEALRAEAAASAQAAARVPELLAAAREREDEAEARSRRLAGEVAADPAAEEVLAVRREAAELDAEAAELRQRALEAERRLDAAEAPVRALEVEAAEARLALRERELDLYAEALEAVLARERAEQDAEVARREAEAARAATPAERFVAEREAEIARALRDAGAAEGRLVEVRQAREDEERRQAAEQAELDGLREYVERAGDSERAARRLQQAYERTRLRRTSLATDRPMVPAADVEAWRDRRFEVEDALFRLEETQEALEAEALAAVPEAERAALAARSAELRRELRAALRTERDRLDELLGAVDRLQLARDERLALVAESELFLRSRLFWLRDAEPVGPRVLGRLPDEARAVGAWGASLGSAEVRERLADSLASASGIANLVLVLVLLPAALVFARRRIRASARRLAARAAEARRTGPRLAAGAAALLAAALLPAYLVAAARVLETAGLPPRIGPVLAEAVEHLGWVLLAWLLARVFLSPRGAASSYVPLAPEVTEGLLALLRRVLLAVVLLHLPWSLLVDPPFSLVAMPRLLWPAFVGAVGIAGLAALRPATPLARRLGSGSPSLVGKAWRTVHGLAGLLVAAAVALDLLGYRFASRSLAEALAVSAGTLLGLRVLYAATAGAADAVARRRVEPEGVLRVRRAVRFVFVAAAVVLLAVTWGLDEQAFGALDELHLYEFSGESDEYVSVADLVRAVLFLAGTMLVLRYLPGIYEVTVFPRLGLDAGLKYAVLTMSRYAIFAVGLVLALAAVHLDLGRLGWLVAAMGIGLGFGLQEIVSNFVSGIILLIERPVRVDDVVTIGKVDGRIQRINIRATTVLNWDRQEIIVPNRDLITKEVTNWTRGDTIVRLVVPIGVAYGTDPQRVTDMLLAIAEEQPEVLRDPGPQALFLRHGESSLDFELRVFVPDPGKKLLLLDRLNKRINAALAEAGIEIPFPQRDLHVRSSAVSLQELGVEPVGG